MNDRGWGKVKRVELATLKTDREYQRLPPAAHVRRITRDLDPVLLGFLTVGERADGSRWLIDGQCRCLGLQARGVSHWWAIVHPSNGQEFEADLFVKLNRGRKGLTGLQLYHSGLAAGDPETLAVDQVVQERGFEVPRQVTGKGVRWPQLACPGKLYAIYREGGEEGLHRTLDVLARSWEEHDEACRDSVIEGVWLTLRDLDPRVSDQQVVKVFRRNSLGFVQELARERWNGRHRPGGQQVAEVLTELVQCGSRRRKAA